MVFRPAFATPPIRSKSNVLRRSPIRHTHQHEKLSSTELCSILDGSGMLISSVDTQTAAALVLPLLTYKLAATLNGQRLQWYLDASIALVLVVFLTTLIK